MICFRHFLGKLQYFFKFIEKNYKCLHFYWKNCKNLNFSKKIVKNWHFNQENYIFSNILWFYNKKVLYFRILPYIQQKKWHFSENLFEKRHFALHTAAKSGIISLKISSKSGILPYIQLKKWTNLSTMIFEKWSLVIHTAGKS